MKNFIQEGSTLTLPAPYNLVSGDGVLVGNIFGIANETAPIGNNVDLDVEGVFTLPKASGALTLGQRVYWDNTAKNITGTATGNTLVGVTVEAVASVSTTCVVRLNGSF